MEARSRIRRTRQSLPPLKEMASSLKLAVRLAGFLCWRGGRSRVGGQRAVHYGERCAGLRLNARCEVILGERGQEGLDLCTETGAYLW